jgi:catechol 2,3-dioxygenase-like lactoylglutathione lyase family enzyme
MSLRDHRLGTAVAVADFGRAREFYEGRLGLVAKELSEDQMATYQCGGGSLLTVYSSPDFAGNEGGTVGGWDVDDFDTEISELESRGVVFERYDLPGMKTDERGVFDAGGMKIAWFRDPEGNTFAING